MRILYEGKGVLWHVAPFKKQSIPWLELFNGCCTLSKIAEYSEDMQYFNEYWVKSILTVGLDQYTSFMLD